MYSTCFSVDLNHTATITWCVSPVYFNPGPALHLCQIVLLPLCPNFLVFLVWLPPVFHLFLQTSWHCICFDLLVEILPGFQLSLFWNKTFVLRNWHHYQNLLLHLSPTTSVTTAWWGDFQFWRAGLRGWPVHSDILCLDFDVLSHCIMLRSNNETDICLQLKNYLLLSTFQFYDKSNSTSAVLAHLEPVSPSTPSLLSIIYSSPVSQRKVKCLVC